MAKKAEKSIPLTATVVSVQSGPITPHSQAVYEAGKSILIDSLEKASEFCKSMIGISMSAIPTYLGILAFTLPTGYVPLMLDKVLMAAPAVGFLGSSIIFIYGYLPIHGDISLDSIDEIEYERNRIIKRRRSFIHTGITFFSLSALMGIYIIIVSLYKA